MGGDGEPVVAVLVRYARAVDTRDWALLRTCFTDEVICDYGDLGSWRGADAVIAFMDEAHAGMGPTQHLLSNFQVDIDGDRAEAVSYVHAVTVLASHPDDWFDTVGIYEDRLRLGADGWRIAERTFRTTRMVASPSLTPTRHRNDPPEASP
jgi:3-phenylpropionate/cinnamic acid dioxygenase small subunit